MLQDLKITDIHIGDEIHVYGQVTYATETESCYYCGNGIVFISPNIVVPDARYTTGYITTIEIILHGKYIYHWRTMTPQEIRTIQKNRAVVNDLIMDRKKGIDYKKYLGPITLEEYEERVAIKNIMGRIDERSAEQQAYLEITSYYINKDSLFTGA